MAGLSIQFHALPSEISLLINECFAEHPLYTIGVSFPPFAATELTFDQVSDAIINGPYWRFIFTENKPLLPIRSAKELSEKHPDALVLDVGRKRPEGLDESWLCCRIPGATVNERWKRIAQKLRKITQSGAVAVDPKTMASTTVKNHRFTKGAKELNEQGWPMLPIAGTVILRPMRDKNSES